MRTKFEEQVVVYISSTFPLMQVNTIEIERATTEIARIVDEVINKQLLPKNKTLDEYLKKNGLKVMVWDVINGWAEDGNPDKVINDTADPVAGIRYVASEDSVPGVYLMYNMHLFLSDPVLLPTLVQALREVYLVGRTAHKHILLVGNGGELPPEIAPYFVTLDFPLPKKPEMMERVSSTVSGLGMKVPAKEVEGIAEAALGMTAMEVVGALCVSAVSSGRKSIDKDRIFEEKAKTVRRSGLLDYIPVEEEERLGGMAPFKTWIDEIGYVFHNMAEASTYKLPLPRGFLVVGLPGTAKTLSSKMIAKAFGLPLFRLDVGKVFGSLVGETERNTRQLFPLIDAVSPCVILIDEVEKVLAGLGSSNESDAGVTARFIGNLLYYLQDKTSLSFFIFTANDVSKIPPPLMRKGRIDELWFIDLPRRDERDEILKIKLEQVCRDPSKYNIPKLVEQSAGLTGAEIESTIKAAMYKAFNDGQREFTTEDIVDSLRNSVSIAEVKKEELDQIRNWAKGRARMANTPEKVSKNMTKVERELIHWAEKD